MIGTLDTRVPISGQLVAPNPPASLPKRPTVPRYDYKCDSCRKKYELQQSFSAEASHVCEKCGKGTATRLLSVPRIVFKGSGFYVTDKSGKSNKSFDDSDVTGSDTKFDSKEIDHAKAESKNKSEKSKSSSTSSSGSSSKSKSKSKSKSSDSASS